MEKQARFSIGTKFKPIGKHQKEYTIIDILKTYNNAGELVQIRYVAECDYLGQKLINRDICDATIARGLIKDGTK